MRKGEYYKQVGGNFGTVWNGKTWERFDCDGCLFAAGIVNPKDRRQGTPTPKAQEAMRGEVIHRHDSKLHSDWLRASKPITAKSVNN